MGKLLLEKPTARYKQDQQASAQIKSKKLMHILCFLDTTQLLISIQQYLFVSSPIFKINVVNLFFFFFFCSLGPHSWHMQVPRLGVESEPAYATGTTTADDPSRVCDLPHSSQQLRIPDPL